MWEGMSSEANDQGNAWYMQTEDGCERRPVSIPYINKAIRKDRM